MTSHFTASGPLLDDLIERATSGQQVLLLTPSQATARIAHRDLVRRLDVTGAVTDWTIHFANGREGAEHRDSAGQIRMHAAAGFAVRGKDLDHAVVRCTWAQRANVEHHLPPALTARDATVDLELVDG